MNLRQKIFGDKKKSHPYHSLYLKYKRYTMIPEQIYYGNLELMNNFKSISGCIVECGVWRGGMIASIAELLGSDRNYYLFDSFEGLPEAKEIDGQAAINWQNDKESEFYFDNCKAEANFADTAMKISQVKNYQLVRGWFSDTVLKYSFDSPIAMLRLDGDWYESTMDCLEGLFPKVAQGGLIILDDYYTWDGCSRALHDYLSKNNLAERIQEYPPGICYLKKR